MQNKGAIRLLAILFVLAALYQLSFTFFVVKVQNDAKKYAKGNYQKEMAYLDSLKNEPVYNFLWIKKYTLKECQDRQLNLGLDLQGGMNVMLQVDVPSLVDALANHSQDTVFRKALDLSKKEYRKNSNKNFIDLFYQNFKKLDPNAKLAAIFAVSPKLQGQINFSSSDADVIKVLKEEVQASIDNAFNVLRTRIDRFGVTQPNIQQIQGQTGRILVELPGVKDEKRVRKLLQQSASLEFYTTYDVTQIWKYIQELDARYVEETNLTSDTSKVSKDTSNIIVDTTATNDTSSILNTVDTTVVQEDTTSMQDMSQNEAHQKHPLLSRVYPPTDQNQQLIESPVVGFVRASDTAAVNKIINSDLAKEILPPDLKLAWSVKPDERFKAEVYDLIALKTTPDGGPQLGGDVIQNARHSYNQNKGSAEVTMIMKPSAAKKWQELTRQYIGHSIAIVLDGDVYSYPTVQSEISGGVSQITGNFTIDEAQDLSNVLKSGKLPVKIKIVELNHVGPSLGKESIRAGVLSFILAFLVVLVYMLFYYNRAGFAADIALLFNVFLIIGVLASLGAVLTLPGIAGIVLTVGMSVDANVIIFERIREELRGGKGIKKAINDGFSNAYSAIIDANVTTLLTGIILYVFGHGPIQGFATTLIIGIFTSLFSAIYITRLIFEGWLKKGKEIKFASKWSENILTNTNINFLKQRKIAFILSGTIILLGIISLAVRGLDLGVDFVGGRTYVIKFENQKSVNTLQIATLLQKELKSKPEVKTYGFDNQVKITTKYKVDSDDPNVETEVYQKLYDGLKPILKDVSYDTFVNTYVQSARKVGPTIASDIKRAATWAVILALFVIFLYIYLRFKNWQFGLGATIALLHDSFIVIGLFSLLYGLLPFSLEIDQAFIAAILTVVGYSVNDTVIIFDRVREYFKLHSKRDKFKITNDALNSTLSRTLNTSLTTFFVLLMIFLFGGTVIRGFVFALMIGIVVGTYSSLYIATPLAYITLKNKDIVKEEEKKKIEEEKKKIVEEKKKEHEEKLSGLSEEEKQKFIEEDKKKRDKRKQHKRKKKNKRK